MAEPVSSGVIPLDLMDMSIAAALILMAGGVSLGLGLRLERRLAIAAVRTVIQLFAVGYVLQFVFALDSPLLVLLLMASMVVIAGRAAVGRSIRTFPGVHLMSFITLVASGFFVTFLVTGAIIRVEPWYRPQYAIPLLGMILGNGLTGISLCLDQILESFAERRAEVEMELAHGASRWEAARGPLADGVRKGMVPIINSMMVVGIVSLPGMMTGQILASDDPLVAVKYQIVVMFMIAAATSLGCMLMALLVFHQCFNTKHQLKSGFIVARKMHD